MVGMFSSSACFLLPIHFCRGVFCCLELPFAVMAEQPLNSNLLFIKIGVFYHVRNLENALSPVALLFSNDLV